MLVTFTTEAYADITMFGDVAKEMLRMMGNSGNVPGALLAGDVPSALEKLQAAVQTGEVIEQDLSTSDDEEPKVSLSTRAVPLIELMKSAAEQGKDIIWDKAN